MKKTASKKLPIEAKGAPLNEQINIQQISADALHPNEWNPNRMTKEEFAELLAEVRHLGRIAKPVIVRQNAAGFEIVDGEHSWRAAKEAGLVTLPCEVIRADDFEAMRQTYKRNQHGTHDPVLQGRFFNRMLQERQGLSRRALAKEMEVSEGTIRNSLEYAKAAEVRNGYAFNKLSVKQVRFYNVLPRSIADLWLDKGASVKDLVAKDDPKGDSTLGIMDLAESENKPMRFWELERLEEVGLVEFVRTRNWVDGSFRNCVRIMEQWDKYETYHWCVGGITREMIRPYTKHYFQGAYPVRAERDLPSNFYINQALQLVVDPASNPPSFRVSPEEFEGAIKQARSADEFAKLLEAIILEKGLIVPPYEKRSHVEERLRAAEVQRFAPDYIKDCPWSIGAKYALWKHATHESDQIQLSVEELEQIKRKLSAGDPPPQRDARPDDIAWWIRREVHNLAADSRRETQWNNMTEQQIARQIAERLPLYDKKTNRRELLELTQKLGTFKKTELMLIDEYLAGIEHQKAASEHLKALARALQM